MLTGVDRYSEMVLRIQGAGIAVEERKTSKKYWKTVLTHFVESSPDYFQSFFMNGKEIINMRDYISDMIDKTDDVHATVADFVERFTRNDILDDFT